jgi:hypothetical protein
MKRSFKLGKLLWLLPLFALLTACGGGGGGGDSGTPVSTTCKLDGTSKLDGSCTLG